MLVEPSPADTPEANVGPGGALYYAASTALCTPTRSTRAAGSGSAPRPASRGWRRGSTPAASARPRRRETPFNLVIEARV